MASKNSLEEAQLKYDELRDRIWKEVLPKVYEENEDVGKEYEEEYRSIVENSEYNEEASINEAMRKISFLERKIPLSLKLGSKKTEAKEKRASMRGSMSKSTPANESPKDSGSEKTEAKEKKPIVTIKQGIRNKSMSLPKTPYDAKDNEDNEDNEEDIREIIKDEEKVKNYIKSKWAYGELGHFESLIAKMSKNYKGELDRMPLKRLKEIYGNKGILRVIYGLESYRGKSRSTYGKYCEKIKTNYQKLKWDTLYDILGDEVKCKRFSKSEMEKLKQLTTTIKEKRDNDKKYVSVCDALGDFLGWVLTFSAVGMTGGLVAGTGAAAGIGFPLIPLLTIPAGAPVWMGIVYGTVAISTVGGAVAGAVAGGVEAMDSIRSAKKAYYDERNRLDKELKKLKKDDEVKKLIKQVLKIADEPDQVKMTIKDLERRQVYMDKYNLFVNESGKLARKYLGSEGKNKIRRLKEGKGSIIDAYKILAMCLVVVCSKKKSQYKYGKDFFSKNRGILEGVVKMKFPKVFDAIKAKFDTKS